MRRTLLLAAAIVAPLSAHAQSPLVTDRDRNLGSAPSARAPNPARPAQAQERVAGAPNIPLSRVVIEGAPAPSTNEAWARWVGRPLTPETIRAVADAVAQAYDRAGFALYTIQVPDQDFADGVLRVSAQAGHVEEVVFHGQTDGDLSLVKAYGARLVAERPLSRRTLERYISLIRDVPGLKPDIQLLQGQTPYGVKLAVGVEQRRNEVAYTLTTRAQPLLGENQLQADWTINGLTREGDQTRLSVASSTDLESYRYLSLAHGQPLGASGARLQGFVGLLRTNPEGLPIEGKATSAGVSWSYPVIRGYQTNLSFSAGLDGVNSDSAVFGAAPATERTRVIRAQAAYSRQTAIRTTGLNLTIADGLDGLGSRVDPLLADETFFKTALAAGLDQRLSRHALIRVRGMAQFSRDALPSSEMISLGGETYGRAFDTAFLSADRGTAGSVELALQPRPGAPRKSNSLQEVYVFADAGSLTRNPRPTLGRASEHLSSAGGGVRIGLGSKLAIGVEAAAPWDHPAGYEHASTRWSVNLRGVY